MFVRVTEFKQFHVVLLSGSGDMDGMNKVNITTLSLCIKKFILYKEKHLKGKKCVHSCFQNSPNNLSGISNPPGTPRDDGELSGNFLHSFQGENVSFSITGLLVTVLAEFKERL